MFETFHFFFFGKEDCNFKVSHTMANLFSTGPSPFLRLTMALLVASSFHKSIFRNVFVSAMASDRRFGDASKSSGLNSLSTSAGTSTGSKDKDSCTSPKIYRTLQVQIIHRHGDRTPITPLKDEEFWASTLVSQETLDKISSNTNLVRDSEGKGKAHTAGGRGPFGKLTELGLLQLIKVGNKLRDELVTDQQDHEIVDDKGNRHFPHVYHPKRPLHPSNIRVISTDFPRTIQSVQGLLVGLFPDSSETSIPIDVRHTSWMIPDPQPRRSVQQHDLEQVLSKRPHIMTKEQEMFPLAARATKALHHMLASDAHDFAFGVTAEQPGEASIEVEPLGWNQLAEITKCLAVRDMLPVGISMEDQEVISQHAAWRWFENMRDARLAFLAMNTMTTKQVEYMIQHESEPPVTIWSGHDSTLIGLLCAYRLEQPAVWPEYGSYIKIELLEVSDMKEGMGEKEYFVRFSLNGEMLRSQWDGELQEMIPLAALEERIRTEGAIASS
jgi:hypothetical protein